MDAQKRKLLLLLTIFGLLIIGLGGIGVIVQNKWIIASSNVIVIFVILYGYLSQLKYLKKQEEIQEKTKEDIRELQKNLFGDDSNIQFRPDWFDYKKARRTLSLINLVAIGFNVISISIQLLIH